MFRKHSLYMFQGALKRHIMHTRHQVMLYSSGPGFKSGKFIEGWNIPALFVAAGTTLGAIYLLNTKSPSSKNVKDVSDFRGTEMIAPAEQASLETPQLVKNATQEVDENAEVLEGIRSSADVSDEGDEGDESLQEVVDEEVNKQESAYDPDTGQINWDCPCLGGMAHGPCGEEFKAAFSCFVYSEVEPKGIDCVEKFKEMQDCFGKHPEHYKDQLKEEEEAESSMEGIYDNQANQKND